MKDKHVGVHTRSFIKHNNEEMQLYVYARSTAFSQHVRRIRKHQKQSFFFFNLVHHRAQWRFSFLSCLFLLIYCHKDATVYLKKDPYAEMNALLINSFHFLTLFLCFLSSLLDDHEVATTATVVFFYFHKFS